MNHKFGLFIKFVRSISLFFIIIISGCQTSQYSLHKKNIYLNDQRNQRASIVAATKYLKYKCNHEGLPADSIIIEVVNRVAVQKGEEPLDVKVLAENSDSLYQNLLKDNTPEKIKCDDFNLQLKRFIKEL